MRNASGEINNIDWKLIFLYLLLVFIGWINIYSASKTDLHYEILDFSSKYGQQLKEGSKWYYGNWVKSNGKEDIQNAMSW